VRAIAAAGERITGAALANALVVSLAVGRRHIAGLEAAGHVRRIGTGAGTRYELLAVPDPAPTDPVEKIDTPALTITLPPPARSAPTPRQESEALPSARATLPEDVLRGRPADPDPAPVSDVDPVIEWLISQGDKIEPGTGGTWRVAGSARWSDRDLVKRANAKRLALGLPPFSLRRG
jgi:hypothetical protein